MITGALTRGGRPIQAATLADCGVPVPEDTAVGLQSPHGAQHLGDLPAHLATRRPGGAWDHKGPELLALVPGAIWGIYCYHRLCFAVMSSPHPPTPLLSLVHVGDTGPQSRAYPLSSEGPGSYTGSGAQPGCVTRAQAPGSGGRGPGGAPWLLTEAAAGSPDSPSGPCDPGQGASTTGQPLSTYSGVAAGRDLA